MHYSVVLFKLRETPAQCCFSLRFLKFFGFKFWYILLVTGLSASVTGLSPVLLHNTLVLSHQANTSDWCCHEKSFGCINFFERGSGSGSQHIHNALQNESHALRGTFRNTEE